MKKSSQKLVLVLALLLPVVTFASTKAVFQNQMTCVNSASEILHCDDSMAISTPLVIGWYGNPPPVGSYTFTPTAKINTYGILFATYVDANKNSLFVYNNTDFGHKLDLSKTGTLSNPNWVSDGKGGYTCAAGATDCWVMVN